jgi:hypothetical protein
VGVAGKVQANEKDKLKLATVMREKLSYTQIELKPRKSIFHHFATKKIYFSTFRNQENLFFTISQQFKYSLVVLSTVLIVLQSFSCGEKLRNFLFIFIFVY